MTRLQIRAVVDRTSAPGLMARLACRFGPWLLGAATACGGDGGRPPIKAEMIEGTKLDASYRTPLSDGGALTDAAATDAARDIDAADAHPGSGVADSGADAPGANTNSDGGGILADLDAGRIAAGAPQAEVLTPTHHEQPDEVFDDELDASCRFAKASGADAGEVDKSSVIFSLLSEDGTELATATGERGDGDGVYVATFPTQTLPPGRIVVRCSASDTSANARRGTAQINAFLDHGPQIVAITPEEDSPQSARGSVAFEYEVRPTMLVDDDDGAAIEDVWLTLLGREFQLQPLEDRQNIYRTTVDFTDTEIFEEVPSGSIQIGVSATNGRGITYSLRYDFLLDGTGPEVGIVDPADGMIVGGSVTMRMTVTDSVSEVNYDSLTVTLNDVQHAYDENGPWARDGESVYFTFDSNEVAGSVVQITINALVKDAAGNQSDGASVLYFRDEQAPIVDLDPPDVRQKDANDFCTVPFDPLGASPRNGSRVQDLEQYRALVWDRTNTASGATVLHYSGVNRASVDLFIRRAGEPLVIDSTGNGVCDDIDETGTKFRALDAVTKQGTERFEGDGLEGTFPWVDGACFFEPREPPDFLCLEEASDLRAVVGHYGIDEEPALYAVGPRPNQHECTGTELELRSAGLTDYQGWVCLAVRALDNVGNRGVSKPIAVCMENDLVDGQPSCWTNSIEPPPSCQECEDPPTAADLVQSSSDIDRYFIHEL